MKTLVFTQDGPVEELAKADLRSLPLAMALRREEAREGHVPRRCPAVPQYEQTMVTAVPLQREASWNVDAEAITILPAMCAGKWQ